MKSRFTLRHVIFAVCAALPVVAPTVLAQSAPITYKSAADIPVEVFFKQADYRDLVMSPNGKTIAAIVPINGRGNLALIDIATRSAKAATTSSRFDATEARWIGNKYIFYRIIDGQEARGRVNYKGSYYYDVEAGQTFELENTNEKKKSDIRIDKVLSTVGEDSPEAFVELRGRSKDFPDVYRFNFKTRRSQLLTFESPGRTSGWVLDTNDRPRIVKRSELRPGKGKPQIETYWHMPIDGKKWEKIFEESSHDDGVSYHVLGFDNDDKTLYVSANLNGKDTAGIYKYDTSTKQFGDLVYEDPIFDLTSEASTRLIRAENRKVLGLAYEASKPVRVWFGDYPVKKIVDALNSALPDTNNGAQQLESGHDFALVLSTSDVEPGNYSLFNLKKQTLEQILRNRDWVDPKLMAKRQFIGFKARDGMQIYGYLTLPPGSDAKNLPLIVNIHGGPRVRGYTFSQWGRWPEAQFFASRGYAVLELEPRGSKGMGLKNSLAGWKQWGGTMQDDLNDGALHLVKEGIVDKSRMGLLGGSYGGYASLQGMVRDPDLWQCADSTVAVTDLSLLQNVTWSDTAESGDPATGGYFANEFKLWVGDSNDDAALFESRSPARHAANVKGPIMLTMGSDDARVPLIHGEKMRDALVKAGKQVDFKVYKEEGHGFNKDVNVFDFYNRSEKFFASCLKKK